MKDKQKWAKYMVLSSAICIGSGFVVLFAGFGTTVGIGMAGLGLLGVWISLGLGWGG